MANIKKIYLLSAEDEDGNVDTICTASNNVFTDESEKQSLREHLEEYLPIKEEEDPEVLADFEKMVENVQNGKAYTWLDYLLQWDEIDLIN